jgi:predicted acylesterase/phospholipase RssA
MSPAPAPATALDSTESSTEASNDQSPVPSMPCNNRSIGLDLRRGLALACWTALFLSLSACQGLETRTRPSSPKPRTATAPPASGGPAAAATPMPSSQVAVEAAPTTVDAEPFANASSDTPSDVGATPAPTPVDTSFLQKEIPRVGVILGPGGLKAYAHIGVLREFHRSRIPIHAIVGLEWGALMAATYAEKAQPNDVEWKGFRLRESDVADRRDLEKHKPKSPADLDSYLSLAFPSGGIEKMKIPFACPSIQSRLKQNALSWQSRGSVKEAVSRCMPFPPLMREAGSMAAPLAIAESAQWLRQQGATLIVLVNVLGSGEALHPDVASADHAASVLWSEVRRAHASARSPTVNWILSVNTSGQKLEDFAARRASVEAGARAAGDLTRKLSQQYGF